jgi:DNA-binding NtrC family response regulator
MSTLKRQLIGCSAAIREICEDIECASRTDAKVLITGESGVGKEVVAKLIHQQSSRRLAPFVAINCAGVPDSLLESELFGHVRGSFTDAYTDKRGWLDQAQNGTIFLDEVGEMSSRMQAVLLRFLENGEIQRVGANRPHAAGAVRVIAATNRDLLSRVSEKQFREDLYYRLNVIRIAIPPLRERKEDLRPLLTYFLKMASDAHGLAQPVLHEDTMARLVEYSWPGNVRELKNVVERLVIRARSGVIPPSDLSGDVLTAYPQPSRITVSTPTVAERLFHRMLTNGESFWSAVGEPFMARDITRDDLRAVITTGLEHTKGSYKQLLPVLNIPAEDYKRLLSFLRKYGCHLPFQKFRTVPARLDSRPYEDSAAVGRSDDARLKPSA